MLCAIWRIIFWQFNVCLLGLFVDIGNNYSVLDYTNISFVYDDIDDRDPFTNDGGNNELVSFTFTIYTSMWC